MTGGETTDHLFLACPFSIRVWHCLLHYLKLQLQLPPNVNLPCSSWRDVSIIKSNRVVWDLAGQLFSGVYGGNIIIESLMTGLKSFGHTFQVSSTFMSYWFNFVLGKEGEREGDSDSNSDERGLWHARGCTGEGARHRLKCYVIVGFADPWFFGLQV